MLNKLLPAFLLLTLCNCNPTSKPVVPETTEPAVVPTVPAPAPIPAPTTTQTPPVVEPEPYIVPYGWEEVSGHNWKGYLPDALIRPDNTEFDFLSVIKISEQKGILFSADVVVNEHESIQDVLSEVVANISNSATIHDHNTVIFNGNKFVELDTSAKDLRSDLSVLIFLSLKNGVTFSFSCGTNNFSEKHKNLCRRVMSTIVLD